MRVFGSANFDMRLPSWREVQLVWITDLGLIRQESGGTRQAGTPVRRSLFVPKAASGLGGSGFERVCFPGDRRLAMRLFSFIRILWVFVASKEQVYIGYRSNSFPFFTII